MGITALVALSGYNLVLKLTSAKISSLYALPFVAFGVLLVSMIGLLFSHSAGELTFSKQGVWFAIATGALWGVGQIFYFWMFSKGAPFSVGLPFIVGGLAVAGAIIGMTLLREPFNLTKVAGVIVIFLGLLILSRG